MSATNLSPVATEARTAAAAARRFGLKLTGVFLLLATLLILLGYLYLAHRQAEARAQACQALSAIADLKLRQFLNWREERFSDARFVARARFVAQDVQRFLENPDSQTNRSAMVHWLNLLKSDQRSYAVTVFDQRLAPRLAIPPAASEPPAALRSLAEEAWQRRDVVISDLHQDAPNGVIHLDILFPIYPAADPRQGQALALILLKLDARQFLFPLIQSWPLPSPTAETLLVRREAEMVLYLNDLRHRAGSAFALRLPLLSPNLPAARILCGATNVLEGIDYRGVPVVATGRLIPGTPWAMVAKVDREELYAPLHQQLAAAIAALGALLVASGLLVVLLWRQRSAQFLACELAGRKAHEQAIERMNRLYAALSQVNQAVVRAQSREELLRQMCHVLVRFGGFQMAWVGWVDPATKRVVPLEQCGDEDGYLQRIQVFADERPEGRGPVGIVIREGRPCVCNDVLGDHGMQPFREAAAQSGWRSLAAFPIRQAGQFCGALAVYARQQDFFGAQEQALIEEAAEDVSFGLDTLLNDQRRRQAEEQSRQAQQQLARVNTNLEQKVAQRTAQLVEANANLQTFAYTAAHDLRSPLRSIKAFSSLVLEESGANLGGESRSMLERVRASADQMARLLEDLLEYSKISQAELRLEPVSLQTAVSQVRALLEGDIQGKNALVTVSEPLPEVLGHPATVVLLVTNLVSNALKFLPPGVRPQICLWAEQKRRSESLVPEIEPPEGSSHRPTNPPIPSPAAFVRLWVEDNGIGIALKDREKIFGVFQRLHGKQAYPGTGLGLAIVRKGAERMGGRVGVESEPGKGSRFWVELPAVTAQSL